MHDNESWKIRLSTYEQDLTASSKNSEKDDDEPLSSVTNHFHEVVLSLLFHFVPFFLRF
jgi:hypothetical protein